jgi:hypothetical protein
MLQVWIATVVLSTGLTVVPGVPTSSSQTVTGKLAMPCAVRRTPRKMAPPQTALVLAGRRGANCALVVDDKVYTLNKSDKTALGELNKLAWEQAKVTGTAHGDTISVKSMIAAFK